MTRRKDPRTTRTPLAEMEAAGRHLPAFEPVPRKFRHDGWTPERQRAFIGALADTGSVKRAAMHVNMSPEGAYYLRRQRGSEGFRRAWEAALELAFGQLRFRRPAPEGRGVRPRAERPALPRVRRRQAERLPPREERPAADVLPAHERPRRRRPPPLRQLLRPERLPPERERHVLK